MLGGTAERCILNGSARYGAKRATFVRRRMVAASQAIVVSASQTDIKIAFNAKTAKDP
jgi:hypothetical protein